MTTLEERYLNQTILEFLNQGGDIREYAKSVFAGEIFGSDNVTDDELEIHTETDLVNALEARAAQAEQERLHQIEELYFPKGDFLATYERDGLIAHTQAVFNHEVFGPDVDPATPELGIYDATDLGDAYGELLLAKGVHQPNAFTAAIRAGNRSGSIARRLQREVSTLNEDDLLKRLREVGQPSVTDAEAHALVREADKRQIPVRNTTHGWTYPANSKQAREWAANPLEED